MAYVKLFGSILASTIWGEDDKTRLVWITMLACADRDGVVQAAVPGLAHLARVSVADCAKAIVVLTSPDTHSRTKAHDGRRIKAIEGGWLILNYEMHRDRATLEERREKDRQRQIRKRERDAAKLGLSRDVTLGNGPSRNITLSEAEAEAEAEAEPSSRTERAAARLVATGNGSSRAKAKSVVEVSRPDDVSEDVWRDWVAHRKHKRAPVTDRVLTKTRADAKASGMTMDEALTHWVAQGYVGFFPPSKSGAGAKRVTASHDGFDQQDYGTTGAL